MVPNIGTLKTTIPKYLYHWNTRVDPKRRTLPAIIILHDSSNVTANYLSELITHLRSCGYVLVNFDAGKTRNTLKYYELKGYGWPTE